MPSVILGVLGHWRAGCQYSTELSSVAQYGPRSSWFNRWAMCGGRLGGSRVWVITSVADQPTLQVLSARAASSIILGPIR
jgi:hypothetical protein